MAKYKFKAINSSGKTERGTVEAESRGAALIQLKASYPKVVDINPVNENLAFLDVSLGSKKVKSESLVLMCAQFSNMLRCGIQVSNCISMVADGMTDKKLKKILYDVSTEVKSGRSLAASFELVAPKSFPQTFFETIRAGEESGNVDKSFETLYEYFDKATQTSKKIKSALIYPIFILIVAAAVMVVVMIFVVPELAKSFADFEGELPLITKILCDVSDFFVNDWPALIAIIVGLIIVVEVCKRIPKIKYGMDYVKMKIPVFGVITRLEASAQFANTLAMLMSSGLPIAKALKILAKVFKNTVYSRNVLELASDVESGHYLGAAMKNKKVFEKTLVSMVDNGDKTGNMEEMLSSIGKYYSSESDLAVKNLLAKMEPMMLMVVAAIAGFLVFAIYIPVFNLYGLM